MQPIVMVERRVVSVDPFRCRMWPMHDRLSLGITKQACKQELQSFLKHGQRVPALGRPLRDVSGIDVELIYGARRLFIARQLKRPLLVDLRENLTDQEAIIAMDVENRQRTDISPYERGRSFQQWLRSGQFRSQDELASVLNVSSSHVSRLIKLARLPSAIVGAFESPSDLCEGWGLDLLEALEDPRRRQQTLRKARLISAAASRPPPREIFRQLMATRSQRLGPRVRDEVVRSERGTPLFRVRHQMSSVLVLIPAHHASPEHLERICGLLSATLQPSDTKTIQAGRRPRGAVLARDAVSSARRTANGTADGHQR